MSTKHDEPKQKNANPKEEKAADHDKANQQAQETAKEQQKVGHEHDTPPSEQPASGKQ